MPGAHRALRDADVIGVETRGQFAHHPVGRQLGVAALFGRRFEVGSGGEIGGEQVGVVFGERVSFNEACFAGVRQFRQRVAQFVDFLFTDQNRQQVRAGEVAVIVGVFLAAHGARGVGFAIVQACFLHHFTAILEHINLPFHLQFDGFFHEPE